MSRWSCTTCSKSFARKGDLSRHELLHTGIKPHVCETCGKGFAQFSGLKTHWNVHTKAKPYICGIGTCIKAFGDPSSRSRHRKETHRREGAYKCFIPDCGTRIKRRSAFVAHLRKHGLDLKSLDLDAIILQGSERGMTAPTYFATPDGENRSQLDVEPRSTSPTSLGGGTVCYTLTDGTEASHAVENNGWWDDRPIDFRRAARPLANETSPLGLMHGQAAHMNVGLTGFPHDLYPSNYISSNFENLDCFDGIFPATVDYPFLVASPLNLPPLGPLPEAGSDGSQSSSSSPASTYSALYTTDFNDDVVSLSLANRTLQELLPYNNPS